jgi:pseudaminic acid synthase
MITIGNRNLGPGHPTFIIAEVSANHNQNLALARETVHAAAAAGVDAVKLQTYTPDTITFNSDAEPFQVTHGSVWDGRTLYSLYEEGFTPWEWHAELFELARSLGLEAFSSPFDPTAVQFLDELNVPAFKIASFEIVDIPLVQDAASRGKPIILSTGIAREVDVQLAVDACRAVGNDNIIVLKCTSSYPAPASELNLRTIPDIAQRFNCLSGISDHTMTNTASVAAVALGAAVIERHIIVDRKLGGLDSTFSTDANEFAELVRAVRETEAALGSVTYDLTASAEASRVHSRSLFVVDDVRAGDVLTGVNVRSIRPAHGLAPVLLPEVLGRVFARDVVAGTPLTTDMLS